MAFRVVRQRREARRNAKMEEIFMERDKDQSGKITYEQLEEIFRIYEPRENLNPGQIRELLLKRFSTFVALDETMAMKHVNEDNEITKEGFLKIATDAKLLDFDMMDGKTILPSMKTRKGPSTPSKTMKPNMNGAPGGGGLLCCWGGEVAEMDKNVDKIEYAFRKLDTDGDGFLSWEEFQQIAVKMDPDQAERIFNACDQDETGKITLEDFRMIAMSRPSKRDSTIRSPESIQSI